MGDCAHELVEIAHHQRSNAEIDGLYQWRGKRRNFRQRSLHDDRASVTLRAAVGMAIMLQMFAVLRPVFDGRSHSVPAARAQGYREAVATTRYGRRVEGDEKQRKQGRSEHHGYPGGVYQRPPMSSMHRDDFIKKSDVTPNKSALHRQDALPLALTRSAP